MNWHLLDMKFTTVYHLQQINKALNSWLFEVVTGYHIKINLATSVSVPLCLYYDCNMNHPKFGRLQNICMLMASFLVSDILS